MKTLEVLKAEIKACSICREHLPLGPRPVFQFDPKAKILIAGQAPGSKVHASGIPFDDASGLRLREWMGVTSDQFYDASKISILPMGFCYPGTGKSGDLPPRPECESAWRQELLGRFEGLEMTLLVGQYAQKAHFGKSKTTLTERVKKGHAYWPMQVALPHPSPRNNIWLKRNPWFELELLPELQKQIALALAD